METSTTTRRAWLRSAITVSIAGAAATAAHTAVSAENGRTYGVSAHPHFDRVMAPWAVKRFVDKNAKFVFATKIEELSVDAIPMGFRTGELSMHDAGGTCFHKTVVKYQINDPAVHAMDKMNAQGVEWFLHKTPVDMNDRYARWGFGMLGISDALLRKAKSDQEVFDLGFPIYDALYEQITFELQKRPA